MEDFDDLNINEADHNRLISAVSKLDKTQHIKLPTRSEPTNKSSEFNLIKASNILDIGNIAKILESNASHVDIIKKLKKTQDASKVLAKPLEKPQAERVKRATGYTQTAKQIGRWDAVVARNRTTDYVSFPINRESTKMQQTKEFLSKFKLKSPLELELEEVDPQPVVEEEDEQELVYPMSYEEMVEHRQHTAKMRAQQSFKAAKEKRQSKIKSKKYHRILKKEKLKQQLKEFEELQKTDPEEALKKLESMEKARALERHTLRHKNTGKWAKNLLVRAKYDKEVRQQLAEQLSVSRGLTQKTKKDESSDDEAMDQDGIPDMNLSQDPMNPWMLKRSDKSNVDADFDFGYKKYIKDKMFKNRADSESDSDEEEITEKTTEETVPEPLPVKSTVEDFILKDSLKMIVDNMQNMKDTKNSDSEPDTKIVDEDQIQNKKKTNKNFKNQIKLVKKQCKLISTSNWVVEPMVTETKSSVNVLDSFDNLEDNIQRKVEKKLKKIRKDIEHIEKSSKQESVSKRQREQNQDSLEYLSFKNKKLKPVIDEELVETTKNMPDAKTEDVIPKINNPENGDSKSDTNIDPTRFIAAKPKYLNTTLPNVDNDYDDIDDEQVVPRVNIEEVFEEDDVVASFRQEKEEEANKDKPQDIDLSLPGWGTWGGKGVKAPKRKKNRFILKAPPKTERRDDNKGDIIIKEYKDPKLSAHKVKEVPFPFNSVNEYEASIRAPIGNTFIPEKAHKLLIKPNVITKAGVIIDPMEEDELLVKRNRTFVRDGVLKMVAKKIEI